MNADEWTHEHSKKFSIRFCSECAEQYIKEGYLGDGNHGTGRLTDLAGNPLCVHGLRVKKSK